VAQALINLNWKKKKGKVVVVGLTGPSGVGKTCLCDRLSQCLCKCQHSFFFYIENISLLFHNFFALGSPISVSVVSFSVFVLFLSCPPCRRCVQVCQGLGGG